MRRYLFTILALAMCAAPARAQLSFDSLKTLWANKQYAAVIRPLVELRANARAEDQLTIDYMIATSHCRLPDRTQRAKGRIAFDAMLLYHYRSLTIAQQDLLLAERAKCEDDAPNAGGVRFVSMNTRTGEARATYNYGGGKQYYDVCRATPAGTRPRSEVASERAVAGTKSQPVFTRAQLEQARLHAEQTLRSMQLRGRVLARDGVVIASAGSHSAAQLNTILDALLRYRDFYAQEYGLAVPDTVLRVFLAPTPARMAAFARTLHGLQLSNELIGYSVLSDFTLVGIIPGTIYGTLMHELMHVLFRHQYPVAAPWLDEGLAALYEVARVQGERVVGIPNWRGQLVHNVLRMPGSPGIEELATMPTLAQLLGMNWTEYEGRRRPAQQALNHALARYFILYLQDRGKLPEVVRAVGAQQVLRYALVGNDVEVTAATGPAMLELIAAELNMVPAQLEHEFEQWLATAVREGWTPC